MREMKIIFLKEIRSYLNSPVTYILFAVFLIASGWFFVSPLFVAGIATLDPFFTFAPFILTFLVPAFCMRLIAEEEKSGTIEVLATFPVEPHHIILGKFLAAYAIFGIMFLPTLFFPILLSFLGKLDLGVVFSSYLGLLLLTGAMIGIGIFSSSLTRSQVGSYVIALAIILFFVFPGKIMRFLPPFLQPLFEKIAFDPRYDPFLRGIIDTKDLIYFLSLMAFFLFLTFNSYRKWRERPLRLTIGFMFFIILLIINYLSLYISHRFDLTHGKIYSLTPATRKILRELPAPLIMKAYISEELPHPYAEGARYIRDFLKEYKTAGKGKVKLTFIDPVKEDKRSEARRAGIAPLTFTEMGSAEYAVKEGYMGILLIFRDKSEVIPVVEDVRDLEYEITRKIKKLIQTEKKVLVFTKGHGERELIRDLRNFLSEQYDLRFVDLNKDTIPKNAKALIVLGPQLKFSKENIEKIEDFIMHGGNCGFFIDRYRVTTQGFSAQPLPHPMLDSLLEHYGFKIGKGLVFDLECQTVGYRSDQGRIAIVNYINYPPLVLCTRFSSKVKGPESAVFPFVSPVEGGEVLASSSPKSWVEENVYFLHPLYMRLPKWKEKEHKSYPLVVARTDTFHTWKKEGAKSPPVRILVCGTSRLVDPETSPVSSFRFFLNLVDYLMEDQELMAMRSKGFGIHPLKPLGKTGRLLFKVINLILPTLSIAGYGLFRWKRRMR